MKKLLITGASGFLGWTLCQVARNKWHVYGIYNSHPVEIQGVSAVCLNLTDCKGLKHCLDEIRPDAVIHTAAATKPNYCQEHPSESRIINIEVPVNIASICADMKIPYVFTSSDLVFDGYHAPYNEDSPVNPINLYGEQKVIAEREILQRYPEAAICRMPLMYGQGSPYYSSFFNAMVNSIRNRNELKLFIDEYRSPVSTRTAAHGLLIALEKAHGLLHLGGRERVSRYEFGVMIAELMGVNDAKLIALRQKDMPMSAPRAADLTLDSSRAYTLGYNPPDLRDDLSSLTATSGVDRGES